MYRWLIVASLLSLGSVSAQEASVPTAQQRIEQTIGTLVIQNATMAAQIEQLNRQIADLKKTKEEKK